MDPNVIFGTPYCEKVISEERITLTSFHSNKDDCDVLVIAKDKDLLFRSDDLNLISKSFQESWIPTQNNGRKVVEMKDTGGDCVVQALSFYYPKFHKSLKDKMSNRYFPKFQINQHYLGKSPLPYTDLILIIALGIYLKYYTTVFCLLDCSDFDQLLVLCDKWELLSFKKHIEDYFTNNHIHGLKTIDVLTENHFKLLLLADKYKLNKFCHSVLTQTNGIDHTCFQSHWQNARLELQYEIVKIFTISEFQKFSACTMVEVGVMEVNAIFNFFDLILYEDKVLDHSSSSLYQKAISENSSSVGDHPKTSCVHRMCIFDEDDVIVKVEGDQIHMNKITLTVNSPVFNAMLNSSFKEGQDKIVELPGKKIHDVLEFFSFLIKPKDVNDSTDLFSLARLCQEYQVDWLMKKIEEYLEKIKLGHHTDKVLKYLRLANEMGFHLTFVNILNQIINPFPYLQANKLFTILERNVQVVIARKRLWLLLKCLNKLKMLPNNVLLNIDASIASTFSDSKQKCEKFSLTKVEEKYLEKFVMPQQQPKQQPKQQFGGKLY